MARRPKDYLDAPLNDGEGEKAYHLLADARERKRKAMYRPKDYLDAPIGDAAYEEAQNLLRDAKKPKKRKPTLQEIKRKIDDKKIDLSIAKKEGRTTRVKSLKRSIGILNKQKQTMENKSKSKDNTSKKTQMMYGGMANNKKHMYSAGGSVKDNPGLKALAKQRPDVVAKMMKG